MTDPREVLDEIQQRAPEYMAEYRSAADFLGDELLLVWDALMALANLHAALRAVLDKLDEYGATPDEFGMAADIRNAITDALGAADA